MTTAGIEAADVAAERWLAEGRRVNVAAAPAGHDHNDLLIGAS